MWKQPAVASSSSHAEARAEPGVPGVHAPCAQEAEPPAVEGPASPAERGGRGCAPLHLPEALPRGGVRQAHSLPHVRLTYRLELTALGREALNLLLVSRAMAAMASWNWTWMYRQRLVCFHAKIHRSFLQACISRLIRDTKGKVPKWEIEAIYQTAARRSRLRGREYALERCCGRSSETTRAPGGSSRLAIATYRSRSIGRLSGSSGTSPARSYRGLEQKRIEAQGGLPPAHTECRTAVASSSSHAEATPCTSSGTQRAGRAPARSAWTACPTSTRRGAWTGCRKASWSAWPRGCSKDSPTTTR